MKVFITGGSGFVGSSLIRLLKKANIPYINFDKQCSEIDRFNFKGDITSISDLRAGIKDCNLIVHLAAEHRDDVSPISLYDQVNIQGTMNICKIASERNIDKIIFTSSVAVYGFADDNCDESGRINYFNDYGRTKYGAEKVLDNWFCENKNLRDLTIIRPTVIFGPENRGNVYNLIKQIASSRFMMIGAGKNYKSLAYVENVAAFILKMIETYQPGNDTYNYADSPDFNMNDLVYTIRKTLKKQTNHMIRIPYLIGICGGMLFDVIAKISGRKLPISSIRIKKFCMSTSFSSNKMRIIFEPPHELEASLIKTIQSEFPN